MDAIEREMYTICTEKIKGKIEVWGQNLNGRMNTTINLYIKNKIRIINLSIYKTIICGANSFGT